MLEQDIQEAIRKSLPAQVADTLRGELERLAKVEQECINLRSLYKATTESNASLTKVNANLGVELEELTQAAIKVKKRELAVEDVEHRLSIAKLNTDHEVNKVNLVMEMFKTVFANNAVKTRVTGSVPGGVVQPSNQNGYINTGGSTQGYIDTITEVTT